MQQVVPIMQQVQTYLFFYGYGVLLFFCALFALFFLWREAQRSALREETVFDAIFVSGVGGVLMGRLAYFIFSQPSYEKTVFNFFIPYVYPGFSVVGFLVGFWLFLFITTRRWREPWQKYVRVSAIPLCVLLSSYFFLNFFRTLDWRMIVAACISVVGIGVLYFAEKKVRQEALPQRCIFPLTTIIMGLVVFCGSIEYSLTFEMVAGLAITLAGAIALAICLRYKFKN